MPKYLFLASYTTEGLKGLLKEGGSSRRDTLAKLVEGLGGTLESFYYAFGETDVYAIGDAPDNETAAALSMAINAAGAATVRTVVLMTPEETDKAVKMTVPYRPPGK